MTIDSPKFLCTAIAVRFTKMKKPNLVSFGEALLMDYWHLVTHPLSGDAMYGRDLPSRAALGGFAPSETIRSFPIKIFDDKILEFDETVKIKVNAQTEHYKIKQASASFKIMDNSYDLPSEELSLYLNPEVGVVTRDGRFYVWQDLTKTGEQSLATQVNYENRPAVVGAKFSNGQERSMLSFDGDNDYISIENHLVSQEELFS